MCIRRSDPEQSVAFLLERRDRQLGERSREWLHQGGGFPNWARVVAGTSLFLFLQLMPEPERAGILAVQMVVMGWMGWHGARAWSALALVMALRKEGTLELGSLAGLTPADILDATVTRVLKLTALGLLPLLVAAGVAGFSGHSSLAAALSWMGTLGLTVTVLSCYLALWMSSWGANSWWRTLGVLGVFYLAACSAAGLAHAGDEASLWLLPALPLAFLWPARRGALRSLEPGARTPRKAALRPSRRRGLQRVENPVLYRYGLRYYRSRLGWLLAAMLVTGMAFFPMAFASIFIHSSMPGEFAVLFALMPSLMVAWFAQTTVAWLVYRENREHSLELFQLTRVKAPAVVDGYAWLGSLPYLVATLLVSAGLAVTLPAPVGGMMASGIPAILLIILVGGYMGQWMGWLFRNRLWALGAGIFLGIFGLEMALLLPVMAAPEGLRTLALVVAAVASLAVVRRGCLKAISHGDEVGFTPA